MTESAVTDEEVKQAAIEYLSSKGDQPFRVTHGGWELWESHTTAMRAALSAAAKVRAIRERDGEVKSFAGSIPAYAKWCQPGDRQDKRLFIVRFDDPDCRDSVFSDEVEARAFYAKATLNWNCYLFGALPAHPAAASPIPATDAEVDGNKPS